jgi:Leucine-rich repeat (LRR) protein
MKEEITPQKIYQYFLNGEINREDSIDQLLSLINSSEDGNLRATSIDVIANLDPKEELIFKILENHLISDENARVRASAAKVIILDFLEEGLEPLEWTSKHDKSPLVLNTILDTYKFKKKSTYETLEYNLSSFLEDFAVDLGVVNEEAKFFLDLESIFSIGELNYTINNVDYKIFEFLYDRMDPTPWLVIKNNHVEVLNLNFFNWRYIKQNEDLRESFSRLKYMDDYLNSIQKFSIQNNNSFQVPQSIGRLTYLKKLVLKGNKLNNIPNSIKNLSSLMVLNLSHNQLQEIPEILKTLPSLEQLNLKYNNIQDVPSSMQNFINSLTEFLI